MNNQLQLEPPPQTFLSPLLELRDHYTRLVKEYEALYTQARSQLDHVEALLSNWSSNSKINHQLSTVEVAYRELAPDSSEEVQKDEEENDHSSSNSLASLNTFAADVPDTDEPRASSTSPAIDRYVESQENFIKGADIPMLPEYKSLSRMEAIKQLLQEHLGTVCHIDFIVRSLYGDLAPTVFKVVKGRVQSSLTQGKERNVWSAIPDEPGCYTLDLSMVNSNRTNGYAQAGKPKKKKPIVLPKAKIIPMLRVFEGQFLIDAITSFLRQNPGKVFSVGEIITGLYGELDSQEIREIKSKVLNELSRGYRTGRFSRVPDKVGFYTWDTNLVLEASSG